VKNWEDPLQLPILSSVFVMSEKIAIYREGVQMFQIVEDLFPICRSITGHGVRQTLGYIKHHLPELVLCEVPSGTQAFDWTVPDEWNISDGYIITPDGRKIADFKEHNLHVLGYSEGVDKTVTLDELQKCLHSLPDQPDAIPYVTSYYKKRWGFCLTEFERNQLLPGEYKVKIEATLEPGNLTYGELIIPGETDEEVFLSTYVCHPSMANNELSGPAVVVALAQWLKQVKRRYTYRIIFIPERIGSLVYLSRNMEYMKNHIIAGFNVTCVGDDRAYSYLPSRYGDALADKVALNILSFMHPGFVYYSYLERGSDENQYCAPGCGLPVCSIMRSKYGEYPEYHTSLDDLNLVSPEGLQGAFDVYKACIIAVERNRIYRTTCLMEPQLGKRGLYPDLSHKKSADQYVRYIRNFIAYADGTNDLIDISNIIKVPISILYRIVETLQQEDLLVEVTDVN